jgi:hypothetical protein
VPCILQLHDSASNPSSKPEHRLVVYLQECMAPPSADPLLLLPVCLCALQCGFVAPAPQALGFDSFQPFFVPRASATPCFCQQPYFINPFFPQASPADDFATASQALARNFAEAVDEVFGGKAHTQRHSALLIQAQLGSR